MLQAWLCWLFGISLVCGCRPPATPPKPAPSVWLDPDAARIDDDPDGVSERHDDWFTDVTGKSGIDAVYHTGREADRLSILETLGGGVCVFDLDLDGDLDLYCPGGGTLEGATGKASGRAGKLYRNDRDFRFVDITDEAGLNFPADYSHGAVAGDYDRDGDPDLFLFCFGQSHLFRNDHGRFVDVTASAGLLFPSWDTAAVMADLTGDGWPDLYVATYVQFDPTKATPCGPPDQPDVCPPQNYTSLPDRLYVNQGDGTFRDRSQAAGLAEPRRGLGVLAADLNQDGWLDLYVANDGEPNDLYWGAEQFPWVESGLPAGVAVNEKGAAEGSMGLDAQDIDGDGQPDLVVTNFELEDNDLYRNLGAGQFEHATAAFGLAGAGRAYVGFGTGLCDLDGDNWPDWYVVNGHVLYRTGQSPFLQPAFLFRNEAGRRFRDVQGAAGAYFRRRHAARGAVAADLDGDGGPDLVVSGLDEPYALLKNQRPPSAWVSIRLHPRGGDPTGVGADVSVEAFDRRTVICLRAGSGFASHLEPQARFALEKDRTQVDVRVRWMTGRSELFGGLATNRAHLLREGTGSVTP